MVPINHKYEHNKTPMTVYIAIDDTDSLESRGTGRLAREIARVLSEKWSVFGITRHQLYVHPDILYTSHNSCAVIHVNGCGMEAVNTLFSIAEEIMLSDFIDGSDPGRVHPKIRGMPSGNYCCSHAAATPSDVLH